MPGPGSGILDGAGGAGVPAFAADPVADVVPGCGVFAAGLAISY